MAKDEYMVFYIDEGVVCIFLKDGSDENPTTPVTRSLFRAATSTVIVSDDSYVLNIAYEWSGNTIFTRRNEHISRYVADCNVGFCLEPSILSVKTGNSNSRSLASLNKVRVMKGCDIFIDVTPDMRYRIMLIANYGYQYPDHQIDKFCWATLDWIITNHPSNLGSYAWERGEINKLIANHAKLTSLDGETKTVKLGETVTITDTNNILDKFEVRKSTKGLSDIKISGNKITFTVTSKDTKLTLKKKGVLKEGASLVHADGATQRMCV